MFLKYILKKNKYLELKIEYIFEVEVDLKKVK